MKAVYKKLSNIKFNFQKSILNKTILFKNLMNELDTLKSECLIIALESLNDKVCFKMRGNLGNQMFVHATAISQCLDLSKIFYDVSECQYALNNYDINIPVSLFNYEKVLKDSLIYEIVPYSLYNANFINDDNNLYIKGYFQNEKYFIHNREKLIKVFSFSEIDSIEYQNVLDRICNTNSVLLNFRVKNDYKKLGWVIDFSYQKTAMDYIASCLDKPRFFCFADDIDFVKNNFVSNYDIEFVDIEKQNPSKIYIDLELMKKCKHAIIPNSTFSWWAAWLNENPNKIIVAPEPWMHKQSEIIPPSWVKLSAPKIPCKKPLLV